MDRLKYEWDVRRTRLSVFRKQRQIGTIMLRIGWKTWMYFPFPSQPLYHEELVELYLKTMKMNTEGEIEFEPYNRFEESEDHTQWTHTHEIIIT